MMMLMIRRENAFCDINDMIEIIYDDDTVGNKNSF